MWCDSYMHLHSHESPSAEAADCNLGRIDLVTVTSVLITATTQTRGSSSSGLAKGDVVCWQEILRSEARQTKTKISYGPRGFAVATTATASTIATTTQTRVEKDIFVGSFCVSGMRVVVVLVCVDVVDDSS